MNNLTVSWFSAGVSSAVATWLMRDKVDRIIYCHIDDQHADTMRFVKDCETWIGKPIEILQHDIKNVQDACLLRSYINGTGGAPCSGMLKREVRKRWEVENRFFNDFTYIWGMDKDECDRADRLVESMPNEQHVFPLIKHHITKKQAHGILEKHRIKRPVMYDLGYLNNNCVGCVKGGMRYWNKIRKDFPKVFKQRAEMERSIGASCINGTFLDELDPAKGRDQQPIVPECGMFCETIKETYETH